MKSLRLPALRGRAKAPSNRSIAGDIATSLRLCSFSRPSSFGPAKNIAGLIHGYYTQAGCLGTALNLLQEDRQLGYVDRDPPGLVAGERLGRRSRVVEMYVGELLPVVVLQLCRVAYQWQRNKPLGSQ